MQGRQTDLRIGSALSARGFGPQTYFWGKKNFPSGAGHTEILDFQGKFFALNLFSGAN